MKRISAAFDGLRFSESTLSYAIALTKASDALLSGVFLESFLYHSYHTGDIFGDVPSASQVKRYLRDDKKLRNLSVKAFETACKTAAVMHTLHHASGLTIMEAVRESVYSDLFLVSAQDTFSKVEQPKPSLFICSLLSEVKCPLFVAPSFYAPIDKITLLYDGLPRAVVAIKMFYHLFPWLHKKPIEVVSVDPDAHSARITNEKLMHEFIKCHFAQATFVALKGDPGTQILKHLSHTSLGHLIVMGTDQRSNLSRWFKPSLAEKMLANIEHPVLIINQ